MRARSMEGKGQTGRYRNSWVAEFRYRRVWPLSGFRAARIQTDPLPSLNRT